MRILFAGTPGTAIPALEALLDSSHEVAAVLTRPDARTGRGRTLTPSPVKQRALAAGLPVLTDRPRGPEFLARLADLSVECAAVVAYGEILRPETLDALPSGWINLHFSVLPAWRGAAPVQRAIIAGDQITGATTFVIEEGLDSGPVLGVATETIRPTDTAGDLLARLADSGAGLLAATLDHIADGTAHPVPQETEGVSHAAKLTTEDARVDWTAPALAVDRLVRGCTPVPTYRTLPGDPSGPLDRLFRDRASAFEAWATLPDGPRIALGPIALRPDVTGLAPGEIRAGKREVLAGTATHAVELGTVVPAGKRPMAAADWARGARLPAAAAFATEPRA